MTLTTLITDWRVYILIGFFALVGLILFKTFFPKQGDFLKEYRRPTGGVIGMSLWLCYFALMDSMMTGLAWALLQHFTT